MTKSKDYLVLLLIFAIFFVSFASARDIKDCPASRPYRNPSTGNCEGSSPYSQESRCIYDMDCPGTQVCEYNTCCDKNNCPSIYYPSNSSDYSGLLIPALIAVIVILFVYLLILHNRKK